MPPLSIRFRRILLQDFTEQDRAAFIEYQTDTRYVRLYDYDGDTERPSKLFDLFLQWQRERPRLNLQLGIYGSDEQRLLGCAGLRRLDAEAAPFAWSQLNAEY